MTRVNPGELLVDNMTQHPVSVSGLRCVDGTEVIVGAGQLLFLEEGNQTMAEQKHTPGPYTVEDTGFAGLLVMGKGREAVAYLSRAELRGLANAYRIKLALECHDGLVAACEDAMDEIVAGEFETDYSDELPNPITNLLAALREQIAKAKGGGQ